LELFLFYYYVSKFLFQPLNLFIKAKVGLFGMGYLAFGGFQAFFNLVQLLLQQLSVLRFLPVLDL
jgi:hypothetical protein